MKMKTTMISILVLIEALALCACEPKQAEPSPGTFVMERQKCVEACVDNWARNQAETGPDALGKQIKVCELRFSTSCTVSPREYLK